MLKLLAGCAVLLGVGVLVGCATAEDRTPISVEILADAAHMQPIGPGVSRGENEEQLVFYLESEESRSWLLDQKSKEYKDLLNEYDRSHDPSLLPRLTQTNEIIYASQENRNVPFAIVSDSLGTNDFVYEELEEGTKTCKGGGQTCECFSSCLCIAHAWECHCSCAP